MTDSGLKIPANQGVFEEIVAEFRGRPTELVRTATEDHFGAFPARCNIERNGDTTIEVMYDKLTLNAFDNEYPNAGTDLAAFRRVYVQAGIVLAMLKVTIAEPETYDRIPDIYSALSSNDELYREILTSTEEGFFDREQSDSLLLALRSDWITTDPAQINAARLSLSMLYAIGSDKDRVALDQTQSVMRQSLATRLSRLYLYRMTMRSFGASDEEINAREEAEADMSWGERLVADPLIEISEEESAKNAANAIPHTEIICSFPMEIGHAERIVRTIKGQS